MLSYNIVIDTSVPFKMVTMLDLVTNILHSYWLYSPHCTCDSFNFATESLYLLISLTYFFSFLNSSPSPLAIICFFSVSITPFLFWYVASFILLSESTYMWNYIVYIFLWLSSLSIMPSGFIHVVANDRIPFFLTAR